MKTERLNWLAEEQPGECSLDEVRKMASELLSCRPYRAMADDVLAACIESGDYDELYRRCMEALERAEPGTKPTSRSA